MSAKIEKIKRGSIAEEMEIEPGDILLAINGHSINDILDYQFFAQDDYLQVEVEKENQEIWSLEIEKSYDEELGLEFADLLFDRMKHCQNRC
ncbi:MAG: PDZ domain-containing protein, partial [Firmicutes bacterium]|nr:PDZ domain-containing protein [Bacillota bacterium]